MSTAALQVLASQAGMTLAQTGYPEAMGAGGGGITLAHYLVVSAIMFVLGLIGFLTRRNLIIMFLCTELMFQAAGIALIAFGRYHLDFSGQTFVIFVLTVAAAEAAMALALVVLLFRRRESLSADEWKDLQG
jgi:NADH-quinone oxidoreductase subunit K